MTHSIEIFEKEKTEVAVDKSIELMSEINSSKNVLNNMRETTKNLETYRAAEFHDKLREINLLIAKKLISQSVNEDTFIIQAISSIDDLDRICNTLSKRVREWYGYYFPELRIEDNEIFVKMVLQKSKEELMKEHNIPLSMGSSLAQKDLDIIIDSARQAAALYVQKANIIKYLEDLMSVYCPNVYSLVGVLITGKLLERARSLKHLAMLPSSTIQMLGAEKALFRHLRNRKIRPPKHGYILSHPFVMGAKNRGTAARLLSAKISIAVKVDYFHGEFIADKLKEDLEKKK